MCLEEVINKSYAELLNQVPEIMGIARKFSERFNSKLVSIDHNGERLLDRTGRAKHLKAMDKLRGGE